MREIRILTIHGRLHRMNQIIIGGRIYVGRYWRKMHVGLRLNYKGSIRKASPETRASQRTIRIRKADPAGGQFSSKKRGSLTSYTSQNPSTILGSSGQTGLGLVKHLSGTFGVRVLPQWSVCLHDVEIMWLPSHTKTSCHKKFAKLRHWTVTTQKIYWKISNEHPFP